MRMRKLYRRIAQKNGVTEKEVRNEMQRAILWAYQNPPKDGDVTEVYQKCVPCKEEIPTPEELICYAVEKIQKRKADSKK